MTNFYLESLQSKQLQSGVCYGEFLITDLQPGQGITIGNQLRRVLLGDVGGTAISAVRFNGINHEFATIPGIREDILEILLNLKGIVIKTNNNEIEFGKLKVQGPLVVTADLIQLPKGAKIINPNHYITTISNSTVLEMEFKIEYGTGYKLASQLIVEENKNFLQTDAIFMPVQKVNFKIENIYDSENKITEQLNLEVWTNGSISPINAIIKASQIIINLFTKLIEAKNTRQTPKKSKNYQKESIEPYTNITIEQLQLSVRSYNCLKKAQINTIGDLLKYSCEDLQELKNFGKKCGNEVSTKLKNKLGIILKLKKH